MYLIVSIFSYFKKSLIIFLKKQQQKKPKIKMHEVAMKCKSHFNSIFKIVFKWKTEGTRNRHFIFQKGSDCWEHQLFKIWNCCFEITILKCFKQKSGVLPIYIWCTF